MAGEHQAPSFTPFGAGWRMLAASLMAHFEIDPGKHPAAVRELGEIFEAETLSVGRNFLEETGLLTVTCSCPCHNATMSAVCGTCCDGEEPGDA